MCSEISAGILSIGSAVPETVLTNADLEKMVDTNDEWIRNMTGISERRIAAEGEATSDYAIKAARIALERANLAPEDIDLVIVATVTGDVPFPATASIVQDALGCKGAAAFDLAAGCSGWAYALATANAYVTSGMYKHILVIGADLLTRVTNWTDRGTCILFGDGAGAAVVGPVEEGYGFMAFELGSDGSGAKSLGIPAGGSRRPCTIEAIEAHEDKIFMEGREVFKFAVKIQGEACEKVLAKIGKTPADVDLVVPHQANVRIIDSAVQRLGLPKDKFFVNLQKYGNTSAASIPIAVDEAVQAGKIKKGDLIVVVGFGAGLTWAAGGNEMGVLEGKRIACVFPGQGSQAVGMGKNLAENYPAAAEIFARADKALGRSISGLCFDGPEDQLTRTINTQPALYTTSAAAFEAFKAMGFAPSICAGHSVGEYAALYAAGAFSFEDGLMLVQERARLMNEAAEANPGAMAAILGLSPEQVEEVVAKAGDAGVVVAANFNSPIQTVISGEAEAVKRASQIASESGAKRVVPLAVSGAFHSPLMQDAADALLEALRGTDICRELPVPVVANYTAEIECSAEEIRVNLAKQITGSVRWVESVNTMLDAKADVFIELGSGSVLAGLIKRIAKDAVVYSVGDKASLEAVS